MTVDLTHELAVVTREAPRRSFRPGVCRGCGVDLDEQAHFASCPLRPVEQAMAEPWRIRRTLVATVEARRLDDLLEAATHRAWVAAQQNGGRP
jgi:hypothetical protein